MCTIDSDYIRAGADAISSDVVNPFVRVLIRDLERDETKGDVMKENDSYSVRAYMASKYLPSEPLKPPPQHLPNNVISWCGLLEDNSGGYDRGSTKSVFSSLVFATISKDEGE